MPAASSVQRITHCRVGVEYAREAGGKTRGTHTASDGSNPRSALSFQQNKKKCPLFELLLTSRTKKGTSSSSCFALNGPLTHGTRLSFTVVHTKSILKPTAFPFSIAIIRNGAATMTNRFAKHGLGGFDNPVGSDLGQGCGNATRLDSRAKEEFTGVNVPNAGKDALIHEHVLDRSLCPTYLLSQITASEHATEWFDS
jgi:hypothetical protein